MRADAGDVADPPLIGIVGLEIPLLAEMLSQILKIQSDVAITIDTAIFEPELFNEP